MNKIVIGIDQSYNDTGVSVFADKKKKAIRSVKLSKCKSNSEKRGVLRDYLSSLLSSVVDIAKRNDCDTVICLIERIRLKSAGFLSIDYIKSIGALNALIVDTCAEFDIPVYSVDTRAWKSQVVGTSKAADLRVGKSLWSGFDPKKVPTMKWVIRSGWAEDIKEPVGGRKKKAVIVKNGERYTYNDNMADSAGIAMYGFIGDPSKLREEK